MTRLGTVELDGAYVIDAGACHGRRLHYGHGRRQRIRDHRAMRPQAGPLTAAAIAFCPARLSRLAGMVKPGPFGTKFYFRTDLVTASPIASSTPDAGHHAHRAPGGRLSRHYQLSVTIIDPGGCASVRSEHSVDVSTAKTTGQGNDNDKRGSRGAGRFPPGQRSCLLSGAARTSVDHRFRAAP
jgi:hypothetical protein